MEQADKIIVVQGTRQAMEAIRKTIDAQRGGESVLTERKDIDGDTAAWILVANLTAQAIPHVLSFIKAYVAMRHVKKIKVGDLQIENPTEQDLEIFRKRIRSIAAKKK